MRYILLISLLFLDLSSMMIRDDTNEIVLDSKTKLMWYDKYYYVKGAVYTWSDAIDYCENDLDAGGFSDWRLPSFNELFSIVDMTKYTPSISDTFINTANSKYWTSTTSKATTSTIYDDVWTIDFNTSKTYQSDSKTLELNLRCVRGN